MNEKNFFDKEIPYAMYEATQARTERTIKRLLLVVVIAIALMFISNAIWLWAWSSYDYISTESDNSIDLSTRGGGDANYIGNDGDIINGEDSNSTESTDENP